MKRSSKRPAIALLAIVTSAAVFASGSTAKTISARARRDAIAMGGADIGGATTRLGEINAAAISPDLHDAVGMLTNKLSSGDTITAVTFSIRKGSAQTVRVGKSTASFDYRGTATVSLDEGITRDATGKYLIEWLSGDGSDENMTLHVTPSCTVATEISPEAHARAIALGETALDGSTTKLGELDPHVISPNLHDVAGKLRYAMASGEPISGITFAIRRGSARSTRMWTSTSMSFDGQGAASLSVGTGLESIASRDYRIDALMSDGSDAFLVLSATPSFLVTVDGSPVELNRVHTFELDSNPNAVVLNELGELHHDGVFATVANGDSHRRLAKLTGIASIANDAHTSVRGVRLTQLDGKPLDAAVSIDENLFTLTGFTPFDAGRSVRLIVLLHTPPQGGPVKVQLTGTFE
jgi:hypothetical protein